MGLGKRQHKQLVNEAKLVLWAEEKGYNMRGGDGFRDPRIFGEFGRNKPGAYGNPRSQHKKKLARDIYLIVDGKLGKYADYLPLGVYWESLNPENRWGGRYNDSNHFESIKNYDNTKSSKLV